MNVEEGPPHILRTLPSPMETRLAVFDLLGREVTLLVSEKKDAGAYDVEFDCSSRASGVYFCRLQAGEFMQTRKLVMTK